MISKKKVFSFEKNKWRLRNKLPETIELESMYYRMMYALWSGNHDNDDRIKKDITPCVRRAIITEMTRLKKKVGII